MIIQFIPADHNHYQLRLHGPDLGECRGEFSPPYDAPTWQAIAQALEPQFDWHRATQETRAALQPLGDLTDPPQTFGQALT